MTLPTHLGSGRTQQKNMNLTLRTEQRYVIKHCATTGNTPIDFVKFMERGSVTCSTRLVIIWHKCFRDGEFNVKHLPRTDRPSRTERDIIKHESASSNHTDTQRLRRLSRTIHIHNDCEGDLEPYRYTTTAKAISNHKDTQRLRRLSRTIKIHSDCEGDHIPYRYTTTVKAISNHTYTQRLRRRSRTIPIHNDCEGDLQP